MASEKSAVCVMRQEHPTRRALSMIADKWTLVVLFALKEEPQRLSAVQRMIEGVTQKMLIQTLRQMEANGLVKRTVFPVVPPHVEYELTALGQSLLPVLQTLSDWAEAKLGTRVQNAAKP